MSVTVGADGSKMSTTDIGMASNSTITALANATTSVDSSTSAATALTTGKNAISTLAGLRADVGANMSRLQAESSALSVQKDNLASARVAFLMWMWLLKALTLHGNRSWCNPMLQC